MKVYLRDRRRALPRTLEAPACGASGGGVGRPVTALGSGGGGCGVGVRGLLFVGLDDVV